MQLSTFSGILSTMSGNCQHFQYSEWQQQQEKGKKLSTKIRKRQLSATVVTVLQFENRVSDNGTVAL